MVQSPDEAHYRMIAHRILDGAVVPFLGAGVNLCGRPEACAVGPRSVPAERRRARGVPCPAQVDYPFEDKTNLLRVSQYVDVMLGDGPLYQELHDVFDADYRADAGAPVARNAAGDDPRKLPPISHATFH